MTKYDKIVEGSVLALRNNQKIERMIYNDMLGAIQAEAVAGTVNGERPEIDDALVDKVLLKYQKTVQEQIDTCPRDVAHMDKLAEYEYKMTIVKLYAPRLIDDPDEITNMLLSWQESGIDIRSKKVVMPMLKKANVDMKTANRVLGRM